MLLGWVSFLWLTMWIRKCRCMLVVVCLECQVNTYLWVNFWSQSYWGRLAPSLIERWYSEALQWLRQCLCWYVSLRAWMWGLFERMASFCISGSGPERGLVVVALLQWDVLRLVAGGRFGVSPCNWRGYSGVRGSRGWIVPYLVMEVGSINQAHQLFVDIIAYRFYSWLYVWKWYAFQAPYGGGVPPVTVRPPWYQPSGSGVRLPYQSRREVAARDLRFYSDVAWLGFVGRQAWAWRCQRFVGLHREYWIQLYVALIKEKARAGFPRGLARRQPRRGWSGWDCKGGIWVWSILWGWVGQKMARVPRELSRQTSGNRWYGLIWQGPPFGWRWLPYGSRESVKALLRHRTLYWSVLWLWVATQLWWIRPPQSVAPAEGVWYSRGDHLRTFLLKGTWMLTGFFVASVVHFWPGNFTAPSPRGFLQWPRRRWRFRCPPRMWAVGWRVWYPWNQTRDIIGFNLQAPYGVGVAARLPYTSWVTGLAYHLKSMDVNLQLYYNGLAVVWSWWPKVWAWLVQPITSMRWLVHWIFRERFLLEFSEMYTYMSKELWVGITRGSWMPWFSIKRMWIFIYILTQIKLHLSITIGGILVVWAVGLGWYGAEHYTNPPEGVFPRYGGALFQALTVQVSVLWAAWEPTWVAWASLFGWPLITWDGWMQIGVSVLSGEAERLQYYQRSSALCFIEVVKLELPSLAATVLASWTTPQSRYDYWIALPSWNWWVDWGQRGSFLGLCTHFVLWARGYLPFVVTFWFYFKWWELLVQWNFWREPWSLIETIWEDMYRRYGVSNIYYGGWGLTSAGIVQKRWGWVGWPWVVQDTVRDLWCTGQSWYNVFQVRIWATTYLATQVQGCGGTLVAYDVPKRITSFEIYRWFGWQGGGPVRYEPLIQGTRRWYGPFEASLMQCMSFYGKRILFKERNNVLWWTLLSGLIVDKWRWEGSGVFPRKDASIWKRLDWRGEMQTKWHRLLHLRAGGFLGGSMSWAGSQLVTWSWFDLMSWFYWDELGWNLWTYRLAYSYDEVILKISQWFWWWDCKKYTYGSPSNRGKTLAVQGLNWIWRVITALPIGRRGYQSLGKLGFWHISLVYEVYFLCIFYDLCYFIRIMQDYLTYLHVTVADVLPGSPSFDYALAYWVMSHVSVPVLMGLYLSFYRNGMLTLYPHLYMCTWGGASITYAFIFESALRLWGASGFRRWSKGRYVVSSQVRVQRHAVPWWPTFLIKFWRYMWSLYVIAIMWVAGGSGSLQGSHSPVTARLLALRRGWSYFWKWLFKAREVEYYWRGWSGVFFMFFFFWNWQVLGFKPTFKALALTWGLSGWFQIPEWVWDQMLSQWPTRWVVGYGFLLALSIFFTMVCVSSLEMLLCFQFVVLHHTTEYAEQLGPSDIFEPYLDSHWQAFWSNTVETTFEENIQFVHWFAMMIFFDFDFAWEVWKYEDLTYFDQYSLAADGADIMNAHRFVHKFARNLGTRWWSGYTLACWFYSKISWWTGFGVWFEVWHTFARWYSAPWGLRWTTNQYIWEYSQLRFPDPIRSHEDRYATSWSDLLITHWIHTNPGDEPPQGIPLILQKDVALRAKETPRLSKGLLMRVQTPWASQLMRQLVWHKPAQAWILGGALMPFSGRPRSMSPIWNVVWQFLVPGLTSGFRWKDLVQLREKELLTVPLYLIWLDGQLLRLFDRNHYFVYKKLEALRSLVTDGNWTPPLTLGAYFSRASSDLFTTSFITPRLGWEVNTLRSEATFLMLIVGLLPPFFGDQFAFIWAFLNRQWLGLTAMLITLCWIFGYSFSIGRQVFWEPTRGWVFYEPKGTTGLAVYASTWAPEVSLWAGVPANIMGLLYYCPTPLRISLKNWVQLFGWQCVTQLLTAWAHGHKRTKGVRAWVDTLHLWFSGGVPWQSYLEWWVRPMCLVDYSWPIGRELWRTTSFTAELVWYYLLIGLDWHVEWKLWIPRRRSSNPGGRRVSQFPFEDAYYGLPWRWTSECLGERKFGIETLPVWLQPRGYTPYALRAHRFEVHGGWLRWLWYCVGYHPEDKPAWQWTAPYPGAERPIYWVAHDFPGVNWTPDDRRLQRMKMRGWFSLLGPAFRSKVGADPAAVTLQKLLSTRTLGEPGQFSGVTYRRVHHYYTYLEKLKSPGRIEGLRVGYRRKLASMAAEAAFEWKRHPAFAVLNQWGHWTGYTRGFPPFPVFTDLKTELDYIEFEWSSLVAGAYRLDSEWVLDRRKTLYLGSPQWRGWSYMEMHSKEFGWWFTGQMWWRWFRLHVHSQEYHATSWVIRWRVMRRLIWVTHLSGPYIQYRGLWLKPGLDKKYLYMWEHREYWIRNWLRRDYPRVPILMSAPLLMCQVLYGPGWTALRPSLVSRGLALLIQNMTSPGWHAVGLTWSHLSPYFEWCNSRGAWYKSMVTLEEIDLFSDPKGPVSDGLHRGSIQESYGEFCVHVQYAARLRWGWAFCSALFYGMLLQVTVFAQIRPTFELQVLRYLLIFFRDKKNYKGWSKFYAAIMGTPRWFERRHVLYWTWVPFFTSTKVFSAWYPFQPMSYSLMVKSTNAEHPWLLRWRKIFEVVVWFYPDSGWNHVAKYSFSESELESGHHPRYRRRPALVSFNLRVVPRNAWIYEPTARSSARFKAAARVFGWWPAVLRKQTNFYTWRWYPGYTGDKRVFHFLFYSVGLFFLGAGYISEMDSRRHRVLVHLCNFLNIVSDYSRYQLWTWLTWGMQTPHLVRDPEDPFRLYNYRDKLGNVYINSQHHNPAWFKEFVEYRPLASHRHFLASITSHPDAAFFNIRSDGGQWNLAMGSIDPGPSIDWKTVHERYNARYQLVPKNLLTWRAYRDLRVKWLKAILFVRHRQKKRDQASWLDGWLRDGMAFLELWGVEPSLEFWVSGRRMHTFYKWWYYPLHLRLSYCAFWVWPCLGVGLKSGFKFAYGRYGCDGELGQYFGQVALGGYAKRSQPSSGSLLRTGGPRAGAVGRLATWYGIHKSECPPWVNGLVYVLWEASEAFKTTGSYRGVSGWLWPHQRPRGYRFRRPRGSYYYWMGLSWRVPLFTWLERGMWFQGLCMYYLIKSWKGFFAFEPGGIHLRQLSLHFFVFWKTLSYKLVVGKIQPNPYLRVVWTDRLTWTADVSMIDRFRILIPLTLEYQVRYNVTDQHQAYNRLVAVALVVGEEPMIMRCAYTLFTPWTCVSLSDFFYAVTGRVGGIMVGRHDLIMEAQPFYAKVLPLYAHTAPRWRSEYDKLLGVTGVGLLVPPVTGIFVILIYWFLSLYYKSTVWFHDDYSDLLTKSKLLWVYFSGAQSWLVGLPNLFQFCSLVMQWRYRGISPVSRWFFFVELPVTLEDRQIYPIVYDDVWWEDWFRPFYYHKLDLWHYNWIACHMEEEWDYQLGKRGHPWYWSTLSLVLLAWFSQYLEWLRDDVWGWLLDVEWWHNRWGLLEYVSPYEYLFVSPDSSVELMVAQIWLWYVWLSDDRASQRLSWQSRILYPWLPDKLARGWLTRGRFYANLLEEEISNPSLVSFFGDTDFLDCKDWSF